MWKQKRNLIDKAILEKYNSKAISIPGFKINYRVMVIQGAWNKIRCEYQCNKIEDLPQLYIQRVYR